MRMRSPARTRPLRHQAVEADRDRRSTDAAGFVDDAARPARRRRRARGRTPRASRRSVGAAAPTRRRRARTPACASTASVLSRRRSRAMSSMRGPGFRKRMVSRVPVRPGCASSTPPPAFPASLRSTEPRMPSSSARLGHDDGGGAVAEHQERARVVGRDVARRELDDDDADRHAVRWRRRARRRRGR